MSHHHAHHGLPGTRPADVRHSSFAASHILPHHRFQGSLGAPKLQMVGTVETVFASPENHHGANHQHFTVKVDKILSFDGGLDDGHTLIGTVLFVAVRFGDNLGLEHEVRDLTANTPIELQGEYIAAADAYPTEDNDGHPPLPVLHFTHNPVGYVMYNGVHYS